MAEYARLRADINIRSTASPQAEIVERFPTNCLVEILEDQGDWLKVKAIRIKKTPSGFIPRLGLVFPDGARPPVFPVIPLDGGARSLPSVPANLPLNDFLAWLGTDDAPPWIRPNDWAQLPVPDNDNIRLAIQAVVQNDLAGWQAWVADINAANRQDEAVMDEWMALKGGGREVFAVKPHYIYKDPRQNGHYWGTALKGQILRWTGRIIKCDAGDGVRRDYSEVSFYRLSQAMTGWFRSDAVAEYVYPEPDKDPEIEANKANAFDLTQAVLRLPQDPEIAAAKAAGYTGAQYIDIRNALGKALRHFCLCGEFCVSAIVGSDIIPVLGNWLQSGYWRVNEILNNPKGLTGLGDLQSILQLYNCAGITYNSAPVSPQFIKNRLLNGEFAISGCSITSGGKVKEGEGIRHWVVVEDVLPVGNSGWVRLYNPFHNRSEVYEYETFMRSAGTGVGMWV